MKQQSKMAARKPGAEKQKRPNNPRRYKNKPSGNRLTALDVERLSNLEKRHNAAWAFDAVVQKAIDGLDVDVIQQYERMGVRYEYLAFDADDKLVRIVAHAPLEEGEKIEPAPISLRESVEWMANMESASLFEIESGGRVEAQVKWYRMIATALEGSET